MKSPLDGIVWSVGQFGSLARRPAELLVLEEAATGDTAHRGRVFGMVLRVVRTHLNAPRMAEPPYGLVTYYAHISRAYPVPQKGTLEFYFVLELLKSKASA